MGIIFKGLFLAVTLGRMVFGLGSPTFYPIEVPQELKPVVDNSTKPGTLLESFKLDEVSFKPLKEGSFEIRLPGADSVAFESMPKIPQLLRVFKVYPKRVSSVRIENVSLEETAVSIPLAKSAKALVWSLSRKLKFRETFSGRYFPGKLIQSHQTKEALFVNLFPIQVDLLTGKVLKVVSGDIKVTFDETGRLMGLVSNTVPTTPSLIVTSNKLKAGAEALKNFHEQKLGIKTSVVTVEEIHGSEQPLSEEDLPGGYKTKEGRDNFVKPYDPAKGSGYNYELAKKVSQYLQKRMGQGSALQYVTILGDAEQVPPSYYFSYELGNEKNFTPTDACYGAVKKCLEPKVAVGRLPFNDVNEVTNYIEKAASWKDFADNSTQELSLFGGKAFPNERVYVGELGVLNVIQDPQLDWTGVRKNLKTQKTYTKAKVAGLIKGEGETPFVYYLDHGDGNKWFVDKEFISSNEIGGTRAASNPHPAMIVSISCNNAAFDETLTNEPISEDATKGALSVGTSLLKAKAGAVAYLGSARLALGNPVYNVDTFGNLELTGSNYSLQILEDFYKKYGVARKGRLGDFSLKALQAFAFEHGNDMSQDQNAWSYFLTALLGDPALILPDRTRSEERFEVAKSVFKLDDSNGFGFPTLNLKKLVESRLSFSVAQSVQAALFRVLEGEFGGYMGEEEVYSQPMNKGEKIELDLDLQKNLKDGTYFMRVENSVGVPRERQLYFYVDTGN